MYQTNCRVLLLLHFILYGIKAFALEQHLPLCCVLCCQDCTLPPLVQHLSNNATTPCESPSASVVDDALFSPSSDPHTRLPFFISSSGNYDTLHLLSNRCTPSQCCSC
ncbi:unnamed protein product [Musa hybrid cultivar]